jgi:iron(III) transport system substrate-binding protein
MKIKSLVAMVIAAAMAFAAPPAPAQQAKGTVVFYSSMVLDVVEPVIAEFHKRHPGIKVDLLYSGSVELEQRIFAELEAGDLRADMIWAANPALFLNLKQRGALQAYRSPHAEAIPESLRDPDGMFYAGRVHNMGIGYNTRLVPKDKVPRTWAEFLEFGPRAATASPLHSGTNFNMLGAFVQSKDLGWKWFEDAKAKGMKVVRGTGDVTRGLTSGEFAVAKSIDYIMAAQAAKGAPVAFVFPKDGVLSLPSPMAISARARNPEAAKVFLDFILSREGQQVLVSRHFLPVRTDVDPPKGLPSPSEIRALPVDFEWMAKHGAELRKRFAEMF